jgi:hypothetical protein
MYQETTLHVPGLTCFKNKRKRKRRTMKMLENKSKLRSETKQNLTFGFGSPKKSLQNVALNSEL